VNKVRRLRAKARQGVLPSAEEGTLAHLGFQYEGFHPHVGLNAGLR
jgi:hypothetical protein